MGPAVTRPIAIVGAGCSETVTAINLLRRPTARAIRVALIGRAPEVGRGLVYARRLRLVVRIA
jgi:uncharacterized NAD(P)/FAD-binding protein YdhS